MFVKISVCVFFFDTVYIAYLFTLYIGDYKGQSKSSWTLSVALASFECLYFFIFRKGWYHSLNNANLKKISAVVPKITELGYTWDSLSVPRQFLESTSSKFCKENST